MTRSELANRSAWRASHALQDELANHAHEPWVRAGSFRAGHHDAQLLAYRARLDIQVVQNLYVVRQKPNRHDERCPTGLVARQLPQGIAHVGLEPGLARRPTAALIHD